MFKFALGISILSLAFVAGCGDGPPSTSNPGEPPPHGGVLVDMPGKSGLVEIVKKTVSGSEPTVTSEVSFYFFKEAYTPFSPSPSTGTLTLRKLQESRAQGRRSKPSSLLPGRRSSSRATSMAH